MSGFRLLPLKRLLFQACASGALDVVNSLIAKTSAEKEQNKLINSPDKSGLTPLYLAVVAGNADLVKLLIASGVGLNPTLISDGSTPLHWAVVWGKFSVVEVLMQNGADPSLKDHAGKTVLDLFRERLDGSEKKIMAEILYSS